MGEDDVFEGVRYMAIKSRCRSMFCSECCLPEGLRVRKRLLHALADWQGLQMWTFTVDPTLFDSPEEAWRYIQEKRCISELIRSLRKNKQCRLYSTRYFYAVEWQKNTEMVHFHVLLDAEYVPYDVVLKRWGLFRPAHLPPAEGERPAFGTVHFTKAKFENLIHAANYATKYLLKTPEHGYPQWVLDQGRIKRFGHSHGLFKGKDKQRELLDDSEAPGPEAEQQRESQETSSIEQRVAKCGLKSVVISQYWEVLEDGELVKRTNFEFRLPMSLQEVREILNVESAGEKPRRIYLRPGEPEKLKFVGDQESQGRLHAGDIGQRVQQILEEMKAESVDRWDLSQESDRWGDF